MLTTRKAGTTGTMTGTYCSWNWHGSRIRSCCARMWSMWYKASTPSLQVFSLNCLQVAQYLGGKKTKASLKTDVNHLIENCYCKVGKTVMQQSISIPMRIDSVPFLANFYLCLFKEEYISSLDKVKARHFHSTKYCIDDLCAINDGNGSGKSSSEMYPTGLELKIEHQGSHASSL